MRATGFRTGAAGAWIAAALIALAVPGCASGHYRQVSCSVSHQSIFILEAQAVPSATLIPCVAALPAGWSYGGSEVRSGLARFWFNSDRAGFHAVEIALTRTCDVSRAIEVPVGDGGSRLRRYEGSIGRPPHARSILYHVFRGGCVTSRFSFTRRSAPAIFDEADRALGFTPRSVYVKGVREDARLTLCGADAPPCPG